jgi:class 3 adenylate cyclase
VRCARCGEENPERARFCLACGASLEAEPAKQERKLVSVLFVDLVGFTGRADRTDPEDVRDMLQTYHSAAQRTIESFGGTLEKFIGDAVMAVFGAPISHGDDAERAVRAGLGVLEAVADLKLEARAAVNTGEAVVAVSPAAGSGEALAMGDVVNTASRLQSSAPPGGLVVSDETYRLTRNAITYEPSPALDAKGKTEPVLVWRAIAPDAAAPDRSVVPMVGRDREVDLLGSIWSSAVRDRRPHLVTIIGPPGIGKSRLQREFSSRVHRMGTGRPTARSPSWFVPLRAFMRMTPENRPRRSWPPRFRASFRRTKRRRRLASSRSLSALALPSRFYNATFSFLQPGASSNAWLRSSQCWSCLRTSTGPTTAFSI